MTDHSSQEYSYFSSLHQSYSQIDLYLVSNSLSPNIHKTTINSFTISDHALVSLNINIQSSIRPPMRWRFNTSLLQDPDFNTLMTEEWASIMEMNDFPEISPSLLCEIGKSVIRGKIISYSSYKKKTATKTGIYMSSTVHASHSRAVDDSVWVEHGDELEDEGLPQTLGHRVTAAQKLQRALHHPAGIGLTGMDTAC